MGDKWSANTFNQETSNNNLVTVRDYNYDVSRSRIDITLQLTTYVLLTVSPDLRICLRTSKK